MSRYRTVSTSGLDTAGPLEVRFQHLTDDRNTQRPVLLVASSVWRSPDFTWWLGRGLRRGWCHLLSGPVSVRYETAASKTSGSSWKHPSPWLCFSQRIPLTHRPHVVWPGQHVWSWSTCRRSNDPQIWQPFFAISAYWSGVRWYFLSVWCELEQSRHRDRSPSLLLTLLMKLEPSSVRLHDVQHLLMPDTRSFLGRSAFLATRHGLQ